MDSHLHPLGVVVSGSATPSWPSQKWQRLLDNLLWSINIAYIPKASLNNAKTIKNRDIIFTLNVLWFETKDMTTTNEIQFWIQEPVIIISGIEPFILVVWSAFQTIFNTMLQLLLCFLPLSQLDQHAFHQAANRINNLDVEIGKYAFHLATYCFKLSRIKEQFESQSVWNHSNNKEWKSQCQSGWFHNPKND